MDQSPSKDNSAPTPGLTDRVVGGLAWMQLAVICQMALQLGAQAILARLLNPEDFGLGAAITVVGALSQMIAGLGIGAALVQRSVLTEEHIGTAFWSAMTMSLTMMLVMIAMAPWVAALFRMDDLVDLLRVAALVFPIQALCIVAQAILQREMRFRFLAIADPLAYAVGYGGVGIVMAKMGHGAWSLVGAMIAQVLVRAVILFVGSPHALRPRLHRPALREMLRYGSGHTLARIGNYVAIQGDNVLVGRLLGAVALGIYSRAYQLMVMPANLFGRVLDAVLFPALAQVQHDRDRLAVAFRRSVAALALMSLPMGALTVILADDLVRMLLGPGWSETVTPLRVLAAGMMFRAGYKISDALARATGAVYRRAWRQWIYAGLVIAGAYIGQRHGTGGVAVGVVLALAVNYLLMAQLSIILVNSRWTSFIACHGPAVATASVVSAVAFGMQMAWKAAGVEHFARAIGSGLVALIAAAVFARLLPSVFLGTNGRWILTVLRRRLPRPLARVVGLVNP